MKQFKITVREVLEREVEVAADSWEEASKKALEKYKNREIVLKHNDLVEASAT